MFFYFSRKQLIIFLGSLALILFWLGNSLCFLWLQCTAPELTIPESEVFCLVDDLFYLRNQAILQGNLPTLAGLYDRSTRNGTWAYEHQVKKEKYLRNWLYKQGAKLTAINSLIQLRRVQPRKDGVRVTLLASTEYRYIYQNEPSIVNRMRIGTYHSLELLHKEEQWLISREWYTDPFADALAMEKGQAEADHLFISSQKFRDFSNLNQRRIKAVAYADKYCGAAANDEQGFKYNSKYTNYNYSGGDCANFASQVLHEGGGFRKTYTWNYGKGASRAWVNAQAFNRYMLNSGRASRIAHGTYSQVLKSSYELLPGDYIAYEKKGKVTHISVVTDADSKGYALTNSHNADRYRVPWDLGYGDRGIKFWLVRVNY
ncbi:MAG: amidase domain-containing protein [Firmicutes bacterium]|nr:amidase domain-containing protein [Bacillota bacterium]